MLGLFRKRDINSSPAHLLLLSKFLNGNNPNYFAEASYWETPLKEKPMKAIKWFIKDEMLEPAQLVDLINHKFKVTELKTMLKDRGLKSSGRKEEMVERLIEHDRDGLTRATKDVNLFKCTAFGKILAEGYLNRCRRQKENTEQEVLSYLKLRRFKEATLTVSKYEAAQIFPRGLGIDWGNYDYTRDTKMLEFIFNAKPKTLSDLDSARREKINLAVAIIYLWGTNEWNKWVPPGFDSGLITTDLSVRTIFSYANFKLNMDDYRNLGIKEVEISVVFDQSTCDSCKKLDGRRFKLDQVPTLPHEKCTSKSGCRCGVMPVSKYG
ncbi:MAG: SAP domain-containing protein [Thermodesulfobacteriota bacterium]